MSCRNEILPEYPKEWRVGQALSSCHTMTPPGAELKKPEPLFFIRANHTLWYGFTATSFAFSISKSNAVSPQLRSTCYEHPLPI